MKVIFIGGSGIISSASTELAVKKGIELYHINRGNSTSIRTVPVEVKTIISDIRNQAEASKALEGYEFDTVVDWISFVPEHIENNFKIFKSKVKQYVFISSASAYQTPPQKIPVTEETPLDNKYWQYSRDKIACEEFLKKNAEKYGMKYTIVRPSHTYDKTLIPIEGGYTIIDRMLKGKPVIVHGDGTSIWTLTNHRDFAKALVGLLDNPGAMNDVFHITSDEWLTWDQIYLMMGEAFGVTPQLVHIPSEIIGKYDDFLKSTLLGDKTHSMIFDNSKIKSLVPEFVCETPFSKGAKEIADWYKNHPEQQKIDTRLDAIIENILEDYCVK
ncbi:MAG: NAD-dependent epimerase/dehydratase family protein [Bacteroidales bacterium]|nr:NAD-dependent epimerase/dehydratase family protein [Bacteroidales bacterium]MBN2819769.1 NAD-dependent epimerase/dehydratase family protein [Bacteroidales bacterium]